MEERDGVGSEGWYSMLIEVDAEACGAGRWEIMQDEMKPGVSKGEDIEAARGLNIAYGSELTIFVPLIGCAYQPRLYCSKI